ncbi:hypothetical protein NQ317_004618 [Molorchus minor]|uniref:Uncharacterized protein n=1 Tax=Molorchus minor TaxID=1323400 RepID=A0ABQ9J4V3_9CUCU|nr:hypothetical protein NQ317_004618 [Molorchus minor]
MIVIARDGSYKCATSAIYHPLVENTLEAVAVPYEHCTQIDVCLLEDHFRALREDTQSLPEQVSTLFGRDSEQEEEISRATNRHASLTVSC